MSYLIHPERGTVLVGGVAITNYHILGVLIEIYPLLFLEAGTPESNVGRVVSL